MKLATTSAMAALFLLTGSALAHDGPRIWLSIESGKVKTFSGPYPAAAPAAYTPTRVFTQQLTFDENFGYYYSEFPGFQRLPNGTIPSGTSFSYDLTGPVLYLVHEPFSGLSTFAPVQYVFQDREEGVPQFALSNELFQTKLTGTGFIAGDLVFVFNGSAGDHNHLLFDFYGNGTDPVDGPDGIYMVQFQLRANGYETSDTVLLLLGKNVSDQALAQAALAAQFPVVPEPGAASACLIFGAATLLHRTKR